MRVALAAAMIACVSAGPAFAAPDLSGAWKGVYAYDGADEVAFDAAVTDRNGALSGRISEPNTFGAPSVARLQATFVGAIDGTGLVQFTKTYDGTGGVSHSVRYIGHLDKEGLCVAGAWWIDHTSGPFQMCRVGDATS